MVVSRIPLSQPASCQTIRTLWINCKNNNAAIRAFKPMLNTAYCDSQITLTDQAEAMPDDAARTMAHEMLHLQLIGAGKGCTRQWQALKIYINGSYKNEAERIAQYNGGGWAFYEAAASGNWQSVNALMQDGFNYIAANTEILEGEHHDNMPAPAFPDSFKAAWENFKTTWSAFTQSQEQASTGGAAKVTAINDCYIAAIEMGEVGQHVFQDDEELRKQFSFDAVGALIEPAGPASFEITVMVNGVAKAGAETSIVNTDKSLVTNAEGKALFMQMQEGDIQCRIVCDGYAEQLVTATLAAGVRKRVSVTLVPLFTGEFVVGSEKAVSSQQPAVGSAQ